MKRDINGLSSEPGDLGLTMEQLELAAENDANVSAREVLCLYSGSLLTSFLLGLVFGSLLTAACYLLYAEVIK
jgi:hypothetical protein